MEILRCCDRHRFFVLPKHSLVERTDGRTNNNRRLDRALEQHRSSLRAQGHDLQHASTAVGEDPSMDSSSPDELFRLRCSNFICIIIGLSYWQPYWQRKKSVQSGVGSLAIQIDVVSRLVQRKQKDGEVKHRESGSALGQTRIYRLTISLTGQFEAGELPIQQFSWTSTESNQDTGGLLCERDTMAR